MPESNPFIPCRWGKNPHLQTILPTVIRQNHSVAAIEENVPTEDGDILNLVWSAKPCKALPTPIVVIFHGLEGSIGSPYVKGIFKSIRDRHWIGCLMHFRGCNGKPNLTARSYHSGDTGDADFVIRSIRKRYPQSPLVAVGYSLGGNVVLKYLGEQGKNCLLEAAVAVSVPFELDKCGTRLESGFSKFYLRHLMKDLIGSTINKMAVVDLSGSLSISQNEIKKLKTFREFDDLITAPLHGFKDADDYYNRSSSRQFLKQIAVPTLIIHARDDPFISRDAIPNDHELSDKITFELTEHGGHVGFVAGSSPVNPQFWLEKRIPDYLEQQLEELKMDER